MPEPSINSSTQSIPYTNKLPNHIAVIMDGNGRWAKLKNLPRLSGHIQGVKSVKNLIQRCIKKRVNYLTLFAFSSENWRRPNEEVSFLMRLLLVSLKREINKMHTNNICVRVIGNLEQLPNNIQTMINKVNHLTLNNTGLNLTVAINYGGRWDILHAVKQAASELSPDLIDEYAIKSRLSMSFAPEVDLLIRTGGESRISNFLLWDLAYAELYFTDILWPKFDTDSLESALTWYSQRERRFGRTSEQLLISATY